MQVFFVVITWLHDYQDAMLTPRMKYRFDPTYRYRYHTTRASSRWRYQYQEITEKKDNIRKVLYRYRYRYS